MADPTPPRHRALTREDVFAACDALMREGQWVTQQALLQRLGHGSLSTIGKHLAAWKVDFFRRYRGEGLPEQETGLPRPALEAAHAFYATALEIARGESERALAAEQAKLAEAREALNAERTGLQAAVREAEAQAQAQRQARALIEAHLQAARSEAEQQSRRALGLEREKATLTERLEHMNQAQAALEQRARQAVQKAREALETEQARTRAMEQRLLARLEEERLRAHEATALADKLQARLGALQQRIEQQAERLLEREQRLAAVQAEHAAQAAAIEAAYQAREEERTRRRALNAEVQRLRERNAALDAECQALRREAERQAQERAEARRTQRAKPTDAPLKKDAGQRVGISPEDGQDEASERTA